MDDMFFEAGHAMDFTLSFDEAADRDRMQRALEKAAEICPYMTLSAEKGEDGILYFVKNDSPVKLLDKVPSHMP